MNGFHKKRYTPNGVDGRARWLVTAYNDIDASKIQELHPEKE